VAIEDITARKKAEDYLRYLGTHDVMTGLYNRTYFEETVLRLEKERRDPLSVLIADVDGLKKVNDSLGHQAGDGLIAPGRRHTGLGLQPVAQRRVQPRGLHVDRLQRVAAEIEGAVCGNQFDNTANRDAHYATTGPEIWHETDGRVDAFTCATGTGGTLGGVSRYLKQQRPALRIVLADPMGSGLYNWVKTGALKSEGSSAVTEGIGIGRVTANLDGAPIDDAVRIEDPEIVRTTYRLLHEEGLFLGSTSGTNVAAAVRVARDLGPGHTIVTILCDGGQKYLSRFYNPEWLAQKGLAEHAAAPRRGG